MTDKVLTKLAKLADAARAARRARDEAIVVARETHTAAAIGRAVGLSRARIVQIINEQKRKEVK